MNSAIGGPWTPPAVVMGMVLSVNIGWEEKWSTPAEKSWINLRL